MIHAKEILIDGGETSWSSTFESSSSTSLCQHSDGEEKDPGGKGVEEGDIDHSRPLRLPAQEIRTPDNEDKSMSTIGERLKCGQSLILLENVFDESEMEMIQTDCIQAAKIKGETNHNNNSIAYFNAFDNENIQGRLVMRMPTKAACIKQNCLKDVLPPNISQLIETKILPTIFSIIDEDLPPSIKNTLLANPKTQTQNHQRDIYGDIEDAEDDNGHGPNDSDCDREDENNDRREENMSLLKCYHNDEIHFSSREPCVNVYFAPHAHIGIHRDIEHLSILINLSRAGDDYQPDDTGTAFYKEPNPQQGRHEPSYVWCPNQLGTVALFGGNTQHLGQHIESGTRVMMVCSLSRKVKGDAIVWEGGY